MQALEGQAMGRTNEAEKNRLVTSSGLQAQKLTWDSPKDAG